MKKLTLTKEVVEKYAPYVRITTDSKPNVGSIRVSNNNFRWSASSEDFEYLFGLSIVMMAYSSDVVNKIKEKYGFKQPYFDFTFEGYTPIELVQLVESTVGRKLPKGGRPKPQFADFKGTLIEYDTKPREVGSTKRGEQVDTPKVESIDEVKGSTPSKPKGKKSKSKETIVESQERTDAVSPTTQDSNDTVEPKEVVASNVESEGSDKESDRFPDSTTIVETEHLEVTEVEEVNVQELLANLDTLTAELDSLSKELDEHKSKIEVLANENKVLKAKVDTALKGVFSALRYTLKESFNRLFGRKQK
jgi:hypothetical protein